MPNNIRTILTPLLIFSYVLGLRIVEFWTSRSKARFSLLYILLLWLIYFFFLTRVILPYIIGNSFDYFIFYCLNVFISLMSVIWGIYYSKKFKKCLKKIDIVDDTLEELGITTDYQKLHTRVLWLVLGWCVMIILMGYVEIAWFEHEYHCNITEASYVTLTLIYSPHLNFISDLIIAVTLGYIGLKYDQINDNFRRLFNECGMEQIWKNHVLRSRHRRHVKISSKYMIWIMIHLHLELRKISREINSIFGVQMTLKMGLYFGLIGYGLKQTFYTIFENHIERKKEFLIILSFWNVVHIFQVLLINCMCESVSVKANTIGNFINKISYSTYDDETRKNISQLLLQVIQLPLKFYGIGLFQFGLKFLYGFSSSIATVVVILIQANANS